jgi:flagellar biosynthesis activator protein FlaF
MHEAHKAYATVAKETANPRELEAMLLLKAASKLQSVYDGWSQKHPALGDALAYNRRLWVIFLDAVCSTDNLLPPPVRQNIANLGVFVMNETVSLMVDPQPRPDNLVPLININRGLAAGLRGKN